MTTTGHYPESFGEQLYSKRMVVIEVGGHIKDYEVAPDSKAMDSSTPSAVEPLARSRKEVVGCGHEGGVG